MSVAKRLAAAGRRDVLAPDRARERSPTGRPRADRRRERRQGAALEGHLPEPVQGNLFDTKEEPTP